MSDQLARVRTRRPVLLLGVVAAVAAVTLVAVVLGTGGSSGAGGTVTASPVAPATPGETSTAPATDAPVPHRGGPARRATSVLLAEAPTAVVLASGRTVPVQAVSTTSDGTLDVPDDIRQAGWWRGGSRLADPFGSTLIAGHIDSTTQGLGPFAELLQAEDGDRVTVSSRGLEQTFVVRSLELVPRSTVNTLSRIFGPAGDRRLVLVTCAPPYDHSGGGYQNLALVTAVPTSEPREVTP
ncbi:class F sortase [Nocardioides sp.]|uniref:class F sortase n=1 Tax=Nocardioides sp. TaxID=35761 RepID=UPI00271A8CED|nr:class F sortase [Nocardioides sp.]MDO9458374.1 class F sortase [Nocardioides sp.]